MDPIPPQDAQQQPTPGAPVTPPNIFAFSPAMLNPASSNLQKRRSSTRSIKRKKFDDELVESSLAKTDRTRAKIGSLVAGSSVSSSLPGTPTTTVPSTDSLFPISQTAAGATDNVPSEGETAVKERHPSSCSSATIEDSVAPVSTTSIASSVVSGTTVTSAMDTAGAADESVPTSTNVTSVSPLPSIPASISAPTERKKSKSSSKRSKKSRPPPAASTKDLGRWKPTDDLALINAVQQTCDLTAVFLGVKFSCKFTLKEIQERWYALMYDPVLSKLAVQAIKQLHPDVAATVNSQALFSKEEETLLGKVASTSQPTVDTFQDLLSNHPTVFHPGRNPKSLFNHWLLMKQYHLLPDQSVPPMPKGDHVLNFSDAEDMIDDDDLKDPKDETLEHELSVADRRQKREIRNLEQELPKWQVLVDSVTGISPPDFDNQTLAVLRGRLVRYLMRSREITLGRATKDNQIDVDLSLEGPAWKISRRQGLIKLKNSGDFYIANEGKRPIYIDGKPVLMGSKQKLNNNTVVEISCLRFIFLINQDLIGVIRQEAQKLAT